MTGKTAVLIPLWSRDGASAYDAALIVESAIKCRSVDEVYLCSDKSQTDLPAYGNFHFVYCSEISDIQLCISFAASHDFGRIVLLKKATHDLNEVLSLLDSSGADSLVSVTKIERKFFKQDSVMADDELYEEEGSLYITSSEMLLKTGDMTSGTLCLFKREKGKRPLPDLSKIKMVLTDCDGCLTDGGMYYSEKGDELKKFNTKDGMAFSLLKKRQTTAAERSPPVASGSMTWREAWPSSPWWPFTPATTCGTSPACRFRGSPAPSRTSGGQASRGPSCSSPAACAGTRATT